jgi:hypothetical protein
VSTATELVPGAFVYSRALGPLHNDGTRLGLIVEPNPLLFPRDPSTPPDADEPMVLVRWYPGGTTPAQWEYAENLAVWHQNHERDSALWPQAGCVCGFVAPYPPASKSGNRSLGQHLATARRREHR